MENIIEVNGLSKVFEISKRKQGLGKEKKLFTAVDNISFNVKKGEIIGFIGPNGAGKSTTIKMMTGILWKTEGDAKIVGYNPWNERKQMTYKIGTMFGQKSSLLSHLPVRESFNLLGAIYDIEKDILNQRIEELVNYFDIADLMDLKVSSLSLGQRMICEVASVTLHRPEIIFFDEPTIGLDIVVKKKVRQMIRMLNKAYNTTIFITSHDISDIEKLCTRIILINHGKIMLDSSIEDIKSNYLSYRKVIVTFEDRVTNEEIKSTLEKFDVKYELDEVLTIEFDEGDVSVGTIVAEVVGIAKVADISIKSGSLENLIYDIYTKKE